MDWRPYTIGRDESRPYTPGTCAMLAAWGLPARSGDASPQIVDQSLVDDGPDEEPDSHLLRGALSGE